MAHRVLVVDPDDVARAATVEALRGAGIEVVADCATGHQALAVAAQGDPTIGLVDLSLSDMSAEALARRLREIVDVEIIAQVSFASVGQVAPVLAVAPTAFVVKGKVTDLIEAIRSVGEASTGTISPELVQPVLDELQRRYEFEQARSRELETTVARLEAMSVTDWLTGLKNHRFFFERLGEEFERARRYDRPLAVLMGDLDDFKKINDTLGHHVGDDVLRDLGDIVRESTRDSDVACRVGGEEIGVIIPETDPQGAIAAAERIRTAVLRHGFEAGTVTISLGVAVFPFHAPDAKSLVEAADRALYAAKRSGKNRSHMVGGGWAGVASSEPALSPVVSTLIEALRLRSAELVEHSLRVAGLAVQIGAVLEQRADQLERLRVAAMLHDVGFLAIPDQLLFQRSPLDDDAWEIIHAHVIQGHSLVADAVHDDIAQAILTHHERFDGGGYPHGLSGDSIPLEGRILHVADAFDAMRSHRPYRRAMSVPQAQTQLVSGAGSQFDPLVVDALIEGSTVHKLTG